MKPLFFITVGLALVLQGCGVKGDPIPYVYAYPEATAQPTAKKPEEAAAKAPPEKKTSLPKRK